MGELYSISGLFYEEFIGISPWGGYFVKGCEGDRENQIVGQLIDRYGPSRLEGILEKDSLEFRKQYERCNNEKMFYYKFSLKNGIWQGEFFSLDGYTGRATCKIKLCLGKLNFERFD